MSVAEARLEAVGRPIKGPSALGGDAQRFIHLTWTLAITEFKLRFFGSVLGYLWQLMRPLLFFGVLLLVFTQFVKLGNAVYQYPVVLLLGIVLFSFFAEATGTAVSSLVDREALLRKIHFPRMVIPLAVVLNAYFNLLLTLVVVFIFALARGVTPRLSWLELVPLMIVLGVFGTGIAMLLSALYVRFRDVRPVWEVTTQMLFYGSPILYTIEHIRQAAFQKAVMCSPLAVVLTQARHAVVGHGPGAAAAIGGWGRLLIPAALAVLAFGLGFWVFNREAPRIAEQL